MTTTVKSGNGVYFALTDEKNVYKIGSTTREFADRERGSDFKIIDGGTNIKWTPHELLALESYIRLRMSQQIDIKMLKIDYFQSNCSVNSIHDQFVHYFNEGISTLSIALPNYCIMKTNNQALTYTLSVSTIGRKRKGKKAKWWLDDKDDIIKQLSCSRHIKIKTAKNIDSRNSLEYWYEQLKKKSLDN